MEVNPSLPSICYVCRKTWEMFTSLLKDSSSQVLVENISMSLCTESLNKHIKLSVNYFFHSFIWKWHLLCKWSSATGCRTNTHRKHSHNQRRRHWALVSSYKDKWCDLGRKEEIPSSYSNHWPRVPALVWTPPSFAKPTNRALGF